MKIVLNRNYGLFHPGPGFCKEYHYADPWDWDGERTDEELVEWVEEHPDDNPDLKVIEFSDDATDWQTCDYDGKERLIVVIHGKIWWY